MGKTTKDASELENPLALEAQEPNGTPTRVLVDAGNALIRRLAEEPAAVEGDFECPPVWGAELWPGPYPTDERQLTELGLALMELGGAAQREQGTPTEQTTPRTDDPLLAAARRAIAGETTDAKDPKQPSLTSWLAFGGAVAGVAGGAAANLHRVNALADDFEHRLPEWATWRGSGDAITWVHHGAITAAATLGGAALGKITGIGAERGAKYAGLAAVLFYLGRELYGHVGRSHQEGPFLDRQKYERGIHVGYVIDASMDVLLPYLTYRQLTKLFRK